VTNKHKITVAGARAGPPHGSDLLAPRHVVSRVLAVMIGFAGILLTGLVAAVKRGGAPGDGPQVYRLKRV
jgi:hypothetical protein